MDLRPALVLFVAAAALAPLPGQRMAGVAAPESAKTPLPRAAVRRPPGMALRSAPPLVALAPLKTASADHPRTRLGSDAIGRHRPLQKAMAGLGAAAWTRLPGESPLWRIELRSPGAVAVRVQFRAFDVGEGEVWVHDEGAQIAGPYNGRGPNGAQGSFWSDLIFGDRAIVEYAAPAGAEHREPPFEIVSLAHLWKSPLEDPVAVDQAAPCQLDVTCEANLGQTTRAVARIVFEDNGGTFNCTGTLLNNRNEDFTPYFLTAAHCISDQDAAETLIAFWNFKTSSCNGAAPRAADAPRTFGASLVATLGDFDDPRGDMTLLVLDDAPDGAYFSGWEAATPVAVGASVFSIHHPQGSYMRLSRGRVVVDRFFRTSPEVYALVREQEGRTEPGSSGGALFSEPGVVVGALSFGPTVPRNRSACDLNPFYGGYTHFAAFYPLVERYLEGEAPPPTAPPAPEPEPPPAGIALNAGEQTDFVLPAVERPTLFRTDSYRLKVPAGASSVHVRAEALTPEDADLDLYLRHGEPATVRIGVIISDASSATASGVEEVTLTPGDGLRSGTWYVSLAAFTTGVEIQGRLLASIEGGEPAEVPRLLSAVSGASFAAGAIAPGQIISLFGQGLGPSEGVQPVLNAQGLLPSSAAQTVVLFDELPAPIFFAQANQINVQVPYQIAGRGSARVLVTRTGAITNPLTVAVEEAAPDLFRLANGLAIAVHADGSLNGVGNPARPGDVVTLYGTGEGLTDGANVAGAPALSVELVRPLLPVSITIDGEPAEVLFAGSAPGFIGLLQVNVRIPPNSAPSEAAAVTLRVGDAVSQAAPIAIE